MMKKLFAHRIRLIQISIVVCIAILIFNLSTSFAGFVMAPKSTYMQTVIVIDAGHGDFDPGASGRDGTKEKDLNLQIALILADIFRANGHPVVMTRTDDTTLTGKGPSKLEGRKRNDTQNRAFLADSFDDAVMISIHQNTYTDSSQHGTQVFYGQKNEKSEMLAEAIRLQVVQNTQPDNERECKLGYNTIYILRTVENPIVMVECGFITNSEELAQLKDNAYQTQLAYSIYLGFCDYQKGS